jgi:2-(1,2-epoxy-1,2-dihydrophenyl)acetyl-CoA isomerase
MTELVLVEKRDTQALVTLNNAKTRNALSRDLLLLLADKLEALRVDDECRSVVITGAAGHFCSGGDVSGMSAPRPLPLGRERMVIAHRIVRLMTQMGKPVVAAVEGYAAGAGFSLAAASDFVVAGRSAKFVSSFAKVSLIPDLGLMWSLSQRVGLAQAKRLILSARVLEAEEALTLGAVDQVVEPGQALDAALAVAAEMSAHAPIAAALVKAAYARGISTLEDALAYEMDNQASLYLTQDHREAVNAFLEKRAPVFRGV